MPLARLLPQLGALTSATAERANAVMRATQASQTELSKQLPELASRADGGDAADQRVAYEGMAALDPTSVYARAEEAGARVTDALSLQQKASQRVRGGVSNSASRLALEAHRMLHGLLVDLDAYESHATRPAAPPSAEALRLAGSGGGARSADVTAARDALERAGRDVADVDAVLCAASNMERAYPAMAIEIQQELGIDGFAFDMNVACSSATFGIQTAADYIRAGNARSVLVVSPEVTSGHLNWRDRDSHFIFGDVATAVLVEDAEMAPAGHWDILGTRLKTVFSNNIRNNFGFLNRASPEGEGRPDKLFVQEGRKVFKEVVPMVAEMIVTEAERLGIDPQALRRLWLHQANAGMNRLIAQRVLGHEASADESPTVLDTYANTSSAGSIIAFHKHHEDLSAGDTGLICSFGAGYSAGAVFVRKVG